MSSLDEGNPYDANLTGEEAALLNVANLIFSIFAVIGSCVIIGVYIFVKDARNFGLKLVMYLSVCDAIGSALNIIDATKALNQNPADEDLYCYFEAFSREFVQLSAIFWTLIMSWVLYQSVCRGVLGVEKEEQKYLLVSFAFPWIIATLFFIMNAYGRITGGGSWCWINVMGDDSGYYIILGLYLPFWLSFIFNLVCYFKVWVVLRKRHQQSEESKKLLNRLFYFPLIAGFCYLFASIHRGYTMIYREDNFILAILHIMFGNTQGLLNAIYFCYTKRAAVRGCWHSMLKTFGLRKKKKGKSPDSDDEDDDDTIYSSRSLVSQYEIDDDDL